MHLARRSLPLRRDCSLARTLKSAPWRCAFYLWRSRRECLLARTLPAVKKERISPSFMARVGSAHIHAPCPPLTSLTAGLLTCTHLARRSLPLRRECSHSRTLPAVHFPYGGSAHIHEPCPPTKKASLARSFYGACSAVLTCTNLKKRTSTVRF